MVEVTCDKCGKECKVPFKPTRGKPVYCSDCFRKQGGGDRVGSDRRGSDRPSSSGSVDLSEINYKLDQIMQALKIR